MSSFRNGDFVLIHLCSFFIMTISSIILFIFVHFQKLFLLILMLFLFLVLQFLFIFIDRSRHIHVHRSASSFKKPKMKKLLIVLFHFSSTDNHVSLHCFFPSASNCALFVISKWLW
eukprot:784925_1